MLFLSPVFNLINYFIFIIMVCNNVLADKPNFSDIEKALTIQKTSECKNETCDNDMDVLLNELNKGDTQNKEQHTQELHAIQQNENTDHPCPFVSTESAEIIILNKITAKSFAQILKIGEIKFFGNLSIEVNRCIKNDDQFNFNSLMLITILDNRIDDDDFLAFHGWIIPSNPSLATFEHPVYEIIPVKCLNASP
jgi:hypothetical protein